MAINGDLSQSGLMFVTSTDTMFIHLHTCICLWNATCIEFYDAQVYYLLKAWEVWLRFCKILSCSQMSKAYCFVYETWWECFIHNNHAHTNRRFSGWHHMYAEVWLLLRESYLGGGWGGGSHMFQMCYSLWENPDYACIYAHDSTSNIAMW